MGNTPSKCKKYSDGYKKNYILTTVSSLLMVSIALAIYLNAGSENVMYYVLVPTILFSIVHQFGNDYVTFDCAESRFLNFKQLRTYIPVSVLLTILWTIKFGLMGMGTGIVTAGLVFVYALFINIWINDLFIQSDQVKKVKLKTEYLQVSDGSK